ncbi:MAG: SDR family oxidoreductase [Acidimicrobiales bacterium]|nr:SDR family oxidoreductase [Acidimicrobiales bacterium]
MADRVVFVTGGAGGIGSAICRQLAAAGHHVVVADVSVDAAGAVADEVGGTAVELDVTDPASCEAAVRGVAEGPGPVQVLVNCAGWDELKPFLESDEAFQRKVLEVNLGGPIRLTRLVLPAMTDAGWGRLVNIASDAGRVGSSLEAIYSAAKGGLIAFTKTIAREVARHGITANNVCPGPTNTPLVQSIVAQSSDGDRVIASMTRAVPMRRMGEPDDIAPAVVYFASDDASFVTGQTLSVSGGLTMA